jgi:hypothetical protein
VSASATETAWSWGVADHPDPVRLELAAADGGVFTFGYVVCWDARTANT